MLAHILRATSAFPVGHQLQADASQGGQTIYGSALFLTAQGKLIRQPLSTSHLRGGKLVFIVLDAIVVERESDATVATPTQVFIAPKGQAIAPDTKMKPVVTADHVEKADVTWLSAGRVKVELKGGRIFRHLPSDDSTGVVIEVRLDGKMHRPEAPSATGP